MASSPITTGSLASIAKRAAGEVGFDLCGIAAISDFPELDSFPAWIAAGYAGEMEYLKARDDSGELKRRCVKNSAPWARSVVVLGASYDSDHPHSTDVAQNTSRGWIARYAWSRDYHDVLMPRLRQVEAAIKDAAAQSSPDANIVTHCYIDTGPHIERVYAKYAGIGWIGKNTCIINQDAGSYFFLGIILTSLPLTPDLPAADRCGTCTRCIDACPTQALIAPYQMDASRCISYLTIEKRGPIPEEFRAAIGNNVFGCDICQDVCPWNRKRHSHVRSSIPGLQARPELVNPALEWLAEMDAEQYRQTVRGSSVKRAKQVGLQRNTIIAMGNSGEEKFRPVLERLAEHDDAVLREHAEWALRQLSRGH
jgi:epoxyqueuosine reductase